MTDPTDTYVRSLRDVASEFGDLSGDLTQELLDLAPYLSGQIPMDDGNLGAARSLFIRITATAGSLVRTVRDLEAVRDRQAAAGVDEPF